MSDESVGESKNRPSFDLTILGEDELHDVALPRRLLAAERWRIAGYVALSRIAHQQAETPYSYEAMVQSNTPADLPPLLREARFIEIQVNGLSEPEMLLQMTPAGYMLMLQVYGLEMGASLDDILTAKHERDNFKLALGLAARNHTDIAEGIQLVLAVRGEAEMSGRELAISDIDPGLDADL